VESSGRQTYENSTQKEQISKLGRLLIESAWLPDKDGNFHKPNDFKLTDLSKLFRKDEHLAKQLGMKSDISEEILAKAGISQAIFKLAQEFQNQSADIKDQIKTLLQNKSGSKPAFPTRKSKNPDYREQKIRKKHNTAEDKTYTTKERSVRDSKPDFDQKSWLRDQYTNDDQILVCQMCKNEMPFKLKDSSYHFEAVQISDGLRKEGHQLYLALCPICAAKYRILVKNDSTLLNDFTTAIKNSDGNLEIDIYLGINGPHKVHFVETHLKDLKTILTTEDELAV